MTFNTYVSPGIEAGGHGASDAPPLFTLLAAIRAALPTGPPIVAAGGITTGAQIAALLTLGAAGAALGTRFLFTPECIYSPPMKAALVHAGLGSTVRTLAYDEVGRTNMWPPACDGRALRNAVMDDVEEGLGLEERLARFDASKAAGEEDRLIVWAGVGVGLVSEITPAAVGVLFICSGESHLLVRCRMSCARCTRRQWRVCTQLLRCWMLDKN